MAFSVNASSADGQIKIDSNGQYYRYVQSQNAWINLGGVISSGIVAYAHNGLITPQMAELLEDVRADGMAGLKIYGNGSYYFLLNPINGLFSFSVESGSVRAELDRTKLSYILYNARCPGEKGSAGANGLDGSDGDPGPSEQNVPYKIGDGTLSFEVGILTPLGTPISIRFIKGGVILAETILYSDGTSKFLPQAGFPYQLQSYEVAQNGDTLLAEFIISEVWSSDWIVRARQTGPPGRDGLDGNAFMEVVELSIDDPMVVSSNAITTLRNRGSNFYYSTGFDLETLPVAHLRQYGGTRCNAIDSTIGSRFAAVEPAVSSSKVIWVWQFEGDNYLPGDPSLPSWLPDPSCIRPGVSFPWWDSVGANPGIVEAASLPEKCCQEDFFFCPNIGSACNIASTPETPVVLANTRYIPCT